MVYSCTKSDFYLYKICTKICTFCTLFIGMSSDLGGVECLFGMPVNAANSDIDDWIECHNGDDVYWHSRSRKLTSWTAPPPSKRPRVTSQVNQEMEDGPSNATTSSSTANTIAAFVVPVPITPKPKPTDDGVSVFSPDHVPTRVQKPIVDKPTDALTLDQLTMNAQKTGFPRGKDEDEYQGMECEAWNAVKLAKALGVFSRRVPAPELKRTIMVELKKRWKEEDKDMYSEASAFKQELDSAMNRERNRDKSFVSQPKGTFEKKKNATAALASSSSTSKRTLGAPTRKHSPVNPEKMVRDYGNTHGVCKVGHGKLICGCGSDLTNMRAGTFKDGHLKSKKHKTWLLSVTHTGKVQGIFEGIIREETDVEASCKLSVAEHAARARAVRAVIAAPGLTLSGVCADTPYGIYYRGLLRNQRDQPCDLPRAQSYLARQYVPLLVKQEDETNKSTYEFVHNFGCAMDGSGGMEVVVGRGVVHGTTEVSVKDRILDIAFVKGAVDADTQPTIISNAFGKIGKPVQDMKTIAMDAVSP